jgi:hypothetical protein
MATTRNAIRKDTGQTLRGGARPGAGRKKGGKNSVNKGLDRELQRVVDESPDGKDLTALVLHQRVYSNPRVPFAIRQKAAQIALPYETERLAATKLTGADGGPIEHRITAARDELERKLLKTASKTGTKLPSKLE